MWKLEFSKLEIKFGNRNFKDLFRDGIYGNQTLTRERKNNNNNNNNNSPCHCHLFVQRT